MEDDDEDTEYDVLEWEEVTDPEAESETLQDVESRIASELGLGEEALQAFKEMNREMDQVLLDAEETLSTNSGVDEARLSRRVDSKDSDVTWIEVDSVPVYRAQFCYYAGGVKLIASWLPDGLMRMNSN